MTFTLRRDYMLFWFDLWWFLFVGLTYTGFNQLQLLNTVGVISLMLVPGLLCITLLRIHGLPLWGKVALAVGLSLVVLMLTGLLGNLLLPLMGVLRPLDQSFLMGEISIVVVGLAFACWSRFEDITVSIPIRRMLLSRDSLYGGMSLLFIPLSILGAFSLNNGGANTLTLVLLFGMAVYAVALFRASETLGEQVLPTALFCMALSLLLMTSLRGWYITGHDIQREFKVFELAKNAGLWSMDTYRDAYNACLSITILPTIFSNLLSISDAYIYKVLYQIIFALCPVLVYLVSRNWLTRGLSFLCALYSMAFPTFFEDMPFLARQEVAFVFFGLMLFVFFYPPFSPRVRSSLFVVLGVGAILSHYSTTYTILALLLLVLVLRPLLHRLLRRWGSETMRVGYKLGLGVVVLLVVCSVFWTSVITGTGGNLSHVALEVISAVGSGFDDNNHSIDALSLLSFGKPNQTQQLASYVQDATSARDTSPNDYYPLSTFDKYPVRVAEEPSVPLSPVGIFLAQAGVVPSIFSVGQLLAKVLEVSVILGVLYAFFRPFIFRYLESELYAFALGGLFFIALNVLVPVLSTEYGVFRALQQTLFVLVPFLVLGTAVLGLGLARFIPWLRRKPDLVPLVICIAFFLYATAAIPQWLGGNDPALHLNNAGFYYDNYYMHKTEVYGIEWLSTSAQASPDTDIEADRFAQNKIVSLAPVGFAGDIFPATVKKGAFVFVDSTNIHKRQASALYNTSVLIYSYPISFLDTTKDRLYDNGGARIYK